MINMTEVTDALRARVGANVVPAGFLACTGTSCTTDVRILWVNSDIQVSTELVQCVVTALACLSRARDVFRFFSRYKSRGPRLLQHKLIMEDSGGVREQGM